MSHEIRTPLNAIIGFSEAIKNDTTVETCHDDADDIIMAGQNLLEIINGILDISKIEANKMEIVNVNYNLKKNCENIAKLIKPRIGEKPIELKVDIAQDIPDVLYGDGAKIKEVITNILTNAVKYTDKGFIDFKVSCINQKDVSTIFISVEDSGRGIKKENLEKMFTKFQRLDEDRNTTIEGTGLGLAITKSLVDMMGGRIVVQSKYGVGSKFCVYLKQKIVTMVDTSIAQEEKKVDLNFENKKVLIVDDNMLNLKVASRLIQEFKLEPELVSSGYECIDKINNGNKYDLILLDDMMPKMTGVETLQKLKEIIGFNTPVVILTANAISGMKEKYLAEGFNDYLAKPIDKNELKRVLSNYLNNNGNIENNEELFEDLPNDIYDMNKNPDEINIKTEEKEEKTYDINILKENGIDVENGINLLGDISTYNDTLEIFLEENKKRIPEMKKYLESKNMSEYAVIAHAIKSDSKYLGFTNLAKIAFDHEIKGKENNYDYVVNHLKEFLEELNKITKIVEKYLKK
jgi:CheY-like chemotaxis protein/HPt (histidine-containing phosphotransfer) domain-containing protein/anti-sigma regulatory factor (Ser/Thr protein kinase)